MTRPTSLPLLLLVSLAGCSLMKTEAESLGDHSADVTLEEKPLKAADVWGKWMK